MEDMKEIVRYSYLHIIKAAFNRIALFQIDSMMNDLIKIQIATPENAEQVLVATDKFYLYKSIWKGILELLYEKYLPNEKYSFDWTLEITPYTIMLCELSKNGVNHEELNIQKRILECTEEEIEAQYEDLTDKMGFKRIGLETILSDNLPATLIPKTKVGELELIFRLMNFPPLGELALFLNLYNSFLKKQITDLSIAFNGPDANKVPQFGMQECLHYSWFHVDHLTYKKYGLKHFENDMRLLEFAESFNQIYKLSEENEEKFKDDIICPCCGNDYEITIPKELLEYKFLLENQALCKKIGMLYLDDFTDNFLKRLSQSFGSFFETINRVDNPECLILVEGDSEYASIPILAFRKRFMLFKNNVQVYNSKSKEKLAADFFSNKINYPNRKIICLLDSDAVKERDNILRVAKDHKDKYRVIFIEDGTFEDIFDLDFSIDMLNELYPEGEIISKNDFDSTKDFLTNVKRFLYQKKKAQFDKVKFAEKISFKIDIDKIPKQIDEIFRIAQDFTKPAKYIKR